MELKTQTRTIFGKQTKSLRKQGLIPAEVFGHGMQNEHVSVPAKDFKKAFAEAGETTVINLVNDQNEKLPVIISDVAVDRLQDEVLAVDFHRIRLDEKLEAKVPVVFVGAAPAEKKGLVLVRVTSEIEIEALPQDIPHEFSVDLGGLENAGQGIYVKDLNVPSKVKVKTPGDMAIVTVTEPKKEEAAPPASAEATAGKPPAEGAVEAKPEAEAKTAEK